MEEFWQREVERCQYFKERFEIREENSKKEKERREQLE
jgi:hypothetical protein